MGSGTYLTEEERVQLVSIDPAFNKYDKYERDYWNEHDLLKHVGDFINNLYIKSSGVEDGTSSYSGGTTYEYDPTQHKITKFSEAHKLFLEKYYRA